MYGNMMTRSRSTGQAEECIFDRGKFVVRPLIVNDESILGARGGGGGGTVYRMNIQLLLEQRGLGSLRYDCLHLHLPVSLPNG